MMKETSFLAGAVSGALVAAGVSYYYFTSKLDGGGRRLVVEPQPVREVSDEIYREQFTRNSKFFGEEGQARVEGSFVVVVGLGGVGSHAAHLIARSGVGRLRLIDFDQVSVSSLNRHALATHADVGLSKVVVMKDRLAQICPRVQVEACVDMFDKDLADELLSGKPDFVLDCIDNLETKADLIKYCLDHGIKLISSMGAGAKADVSSIRYCDIEEAEGDPLAVSLRRHLRKAGVIESKIPVVFAEEKARMSLLPLEEHQEEDPSAYKPIHNLRLRVIPVLGTMPAAMGLALASYVICQCAGQPIKIKALQSNITDGLIHKLFVRLENTERKESGIEKLDFSNEDILYVVHNIFRGRSVLSGQKSHPRLVKWDKSLAPTLDNVVLLSESEAAKHAKITSLADIHPEYAARVSEMLEEIRDYMRARDALVAQGYR